MAILDLNSELESPEGLRTHVEPGKDESAESGLAKFICRHKSALEDRRVEGVAQLA